MSWTKAITLTVAAKDIVAESYTKKVTIQENPANANWPTTDFLVAKPSSANTAIRRSAGTSYAFEGNFHPGQVVGLGSLPAAAAETSFTQDEE